MQTRIFHTKFWSDSYIRGLKRDERELFLFLFTNERIGLSPIYELPHWLIVKTLSQRPKRVDEIKAKFQKDGKIRFCGDWVYIINADKYQTFTGEKNDIARIRQLKAIPEAILKELGYPIDTLSIHYAYPIDSPNNKKSIINNKKSIRRSIKELANKKRMNEDIDPSELPDDL